MFMAELHKLKHGIGNGLAVAVAAVIHGGVLIKEASWLLRDETHQINYTRVSRPKVSKTTIWKHKVIEFFCSFDRIVFHSNLLHSEINPCRIP